MANQYRFGYDRDLLARFPTLTAGVLFAKGIDNASDEGKAQSLLRGQEALIRTNYASLPISSDPHIAAWRAAYSSLGVKPTQYRCAVEALLRHVIKSGALPSINKLVDLCNYVSLRHVLPVAAYDLAGISGPVQVHLAKGDEPFQPLYTIEIEYPKPGEVIYADDEGALSRRWNWRQCDRAKTTPQSRDVLITTEGVNDIAREEVETAVEELAALVSELCGGELSWTLVDDEHPWATFE